MERDQNRRGSASQFFVAGGSRAISPTAGASLRACRFNNHWIIGRIGYRTPAAHRRILLGEAA
ncbi:MAG: hypothetical protein FJ246_11025 [Nitrospira sp.]|nr:hypothetical protein [Nitrospira sp.]